MNENTADEGGLGALLSEAKLTAYPRGPGIYSVLFSGSLRPWAIDVRIWNEWVCLRTHVMTLPKAEATRRNLLDALARTNERIPLCKAVLAWTDQVVLDLEYLTTHVDAPTLSRLVWLLESIAEREYPRLLEIAQSKEVLSDLDAAFRRSPAA